ncbi:hypothetical protein BDV97DRAFT_343920 [Delphinella strobiligena]|nr:hypothetical protein BDV97DRAFT_343920 [Delphinella strobiligena]
MERPGRLCLLQILSSCGIIAQLVLAEYHRSLFPNGSAPTRDRCIPLQMCLWSIMAACIQSQCPVIIPHYSCLFGYLAGGVDSHYPLLAPY